MDVKEANICRYCGRPAGVLDSVSNPPGIALGIYNAGTDVVEGDPLGGLLLSASDILERDLFVIDQFRSERSRWSCCPAAATPERAID